VTTPVSCRAGQRFSPSPAGDLLCDPENSRLRRMLTFKQAGSSRNHLEVPLVPLPPGCLLRCLCASWSVASDTYALAVTGRDLPFSQIATRDCWL